MKILLTAGAFVVSALAASSGAMAYSPMSAEKAPVIIQADILDQSIQLTKSLPSADKSEKLIKVADRGRRGRRGRHGRRRGNSNVAKGVALGVFGAIVAGALSEQAAAEEARRCRRLERHCDNGDGYACDDLYATCE